MLERGIGGRAKERSGGKERKLDRTRNGERKRGRVQRS